MVYIFSWIVLYIFAYLNRDIDFKKIYPTIFVFFLFTLIVVLRGGVGTDTLYYQNMIIYTEDFKSRVEFGFYYSIVFFKFFITNEIIAIRIFGFLFSIIFISFYISSKKDERFVIYYFLLPLVFFAFAMNGIRIGIAILFFYFAIRFLFDKKYIKMAFFIIFSISFHYSIIIAYVFTLIIYYKLISFISIFLAIFFVFILYLFIDTNIINLPIYFEQKIMRYIKLDNSISIFSGLSSVIVISLFILAIKLSDLKDDLKWQIIIPSILFTSIFYLIAIYSYAGLRFLDLIKYSLPIIFVYFLRKESINLNIKSKRVVILAGFVAILFLYRNFLQSVGQKSAFLPYSTFF